ncbi:TIGR03619 family F420-dependent LLM class oxidoreductase [Micromonospora lupini]|uniref:TIGR03619 family F420-dependent LLM class oxidoreductase n=1 Tax=Micromonospora lupini TaxID=285679 RepID=UPI0033E87E8D
MQFWLGTTFIDAAESVAVARMADDLNYHTLALSDHLAYTEYGSQYPYTDDGVAPWKAETHWPDAWVMIGAMAAVTRRLRFATKVYVAPARDLFTVAKAVSTAAFISDNRVTFGVAAGWCRDEFALTGQPFENRGRRLDEMIPVLRALWEGKPGYAHTGEHYDFPPLNIAPVPSEPIPVYIGGESEAALRRVAAVGDGWIGARAYRPEQLDEVLGRLSRHLAEHGRTLADITVMAAVAAYPSVDLYRRLEDKGVDATQATPWAMPNDSERNLTGLALKQATMERFAAEVIERM